MLKNVLSSFFVLLNFVAFAQDPMITAPKYQRHDVYFAPEVHENANLVLELPVFDLPYLHDAAKTVGNTSQPNPLDYINSFSNPGMQVGLGLSYNAYAATHYGLKRAVTINDKFWHNAVLGVSVGAADLLLHYLPLGNKWLRNEYTKAAMSVNHVDGRNETNYFNTSNINVSQVYDADLARVKDNNNPEFLRMQVAGLEGEYQLIDKLQRNNFFYKSNLPNLVLYWFTAIKNVNAISNQTDPNSSNDLLKDLIKSSSSDPHSRDFSGLEFVTWTHDLFHPNEKYNERYNGPLGRYLSASSFSKEEIAYTRTQSMLHYLNCVSPAMFGIKGIVVKKDDIGNSWRMNFAMRHLFTSFGNDVSARVYFQTPQYNWVFTLHNYNNFNSSFQGLEAEIVDYIIKTEKKELPFSARLMAWGQPKDNEFKTSSSTFGALVGLKLQYPATEIFRPFIETEAKTAGWVAGNPFLGSNVSVRLGVNAVFGGQ